MATKGYKFTLSYSDTESTYAAEVAGGNSFTKIATCDQITPPNQVTTDIRTTHFETADETHTYTPGWLEPGEVAFRCQYTPALYTTLNGLLRTNKGFKAIANDNGATHSGGIGLDGYLKSLRPPVELEGLIYIEGAIKVSGKPVVISEDTTL